MPKRYAQLIKYVNKFMIFRYFRSSTIMGVARTRTKYRLYRPCQKMGVQNSSNFENGCEGRLKQSSKTVTGKTPA